MYREPSNHSSESERSVAALLKLARERNMPSAEGTDRARIAALDAWQRSVAERRAKRRTSWLQAAAVSGVAVLIAAAAILLSEPRQSVVARVAITQGNIQATMSDVATSTLSESELVYAGTHLETRDGRLALVIGDALSLRLDRETSVTMGPVNEVTLLAGRIYIDSGGLNAATALRIHTPVGDVQHRGTQFQIITAANATAIQVREGRVLLRAPQRTDAVEIAAGQELRVDAEGRHSFSSIPHAGVQWEWVTSVATVMDVENRPLAEFLTWIAREHGWRLRYVTEDDERAAQSIRLHGSLESLTVAQMLERVTIITGVPLTLSDGVLVVGSSNASRPVP